jgi:hypothetical protein
MSYAMTPYRYRVPVLTKLFFFNKITVLSSCTVLVIKNKPIPVIFNLNEDCRWLASLTEYIFVVQQFDPEQKFIIEKMQQISRTRKYSDSK